MTELSETEPLIKRAFISGGTDEGILEYFRKNKRRFLGGDEKVAEVDRRYYPVGKFQIKTAKGNAEIKDYAYVNLNTGELYYVKGHVVRSNGGMIKKILELAEDGRKDFFNLINVGQMDIESLGNKDNAQILEKKGLAKVYIIRKPGITEMILSELLNTAKAAASNKTTIPEIKVVEKKKIRKKMEKPKIDKSYNLEDFLDMGITRSGFDHDRIICKPNDVVDVLTQLLKKDVVYGGAFYMPYYKCRYIRGKGERYLSIISPKFRK